MRRRAVWAATLALFGALTVAPALGQAAPSPAITIESANVALGQRILVQGTDWPAGDVVTVQVCGNAALDMSADCDLPGGVSAGVGADGSFSTLLRISDPGVPCPCVVRVTGSETVAEAIRAINIVGLSSEQPSATAAPDPSDILEVGLPRLVRDESWTTWFGARSTLDLLFSVRNVSSSVLRDVPLSITFGRGGNPTGFVAAPEIGDLEVGEAKIITVPIEVPAFAWGTYTVKGTVGPPGQAQGFETNTTVRPWGLVVVGLILLQLVLLFIRNRVRGRIATAPAETDDSTEPEDEDSASDPEPESEASDGVPVDATSSSTGGPP